MTTVTGFEILQIIPADNWVASYDAGEEDTVDERLICWALIREAQKSNASNEEDSYQTRLVGLIEDSDIMIPAPDYDPNFVGYYRNQQQLAGINRSLKDIVNELRRKNENFG